MRRPDRVLLPLAVLLCVVPFWFGFVTIARNRLVAGQPLGLWHVSVGWPVTSIALFGPLLALVLGALTRSLWVTLVAACALSVGLSFLSGAQAMIQTLVPAMSGARVSLGAGFWLMQGLCLLVIAEAARRLGRLGALAGAVLVLGGMAVLLLSGALSALSLLREYASRQGLLEDAFLRHIEIVTAAVVPTLVIGLPLGLACHRSPRLGRAVFPVLGLIQTIPSIALFGLLLAPLSGLAALVPALGQVGISGIGLAPAVIALVLYSLLPITRNTTAGLDGVPAPVRDAARGLGMTRPQVFWRVDAILAFPTILAGLRVTIVQAIGLAAVAALIGAGGLGSVMFDGLFAGAIDLVLLGAIPIIALAVAVDLLLRVAAGAGGRAAG